MPSKGGDPAKTDRWQTGTRPVSLEDISAVTDRVLMEEEEPNESQGKKTGF